VKRGYSVSLGGREGAPLEGVGRTCKKNGVRSGSGYLLARPPKKEESEVLSEAIVEGGEGKEEPLHERSRGKKQMKSAQQIRKCSPINQKGKRPRWWKRKDRDGLCAKSRGGKGRVFLDLRVRGKNVARP